jgi:hypothetical protein
MPDGSRIVKTFGNISFWEGSNVEFTIDQDVQAVLEFMEKHVQACRLVGVADALPKFARLLWEHYTQETCCPMIRLESPKMPHPSQSNATESDLALPCADDGSAAVKDGR